jgi:hypothetical protein
VTLFFSGCSSSPDGGLNLRKLSQARPDTVFLLVSRSTAVLVSVPKINRRAKILHTALETPLRPLADGTLEDCLDCGIFRQGFTRIRCGYCGTEYPSVFSCKTR